MKKLIFSLMTAATCGWAVQASAQLQKGTFLVGGQIAKLDFGLGSSNKVNIALSPRVGYFVDNNFAVGVELPLEFRAVKNTDPVFAYGLMAFGRYYIAPKEFNIDNLLHQGRFFAEVNAGLGGETNIDLGFKLKAGAGYAYFITPNVALEAMAFYQGTYGTGNTSGLGVNLGFQIHLPSKKIKSEYYRIRQDVNSRYQVEEE